MCLIRLKEAGNNWVSCIILYHAVPFPHIQPMAGMPRLLASELVAASGSLTAAVSCIRHKDAQGDFFTNGPACPKSRR